jgi:hypothetical protein
LLFSPKRAAGTFVLLASMLAAAAGMGVASTPVAPAHKPKVSAKASAVRPDMVITEPTARPTMHPILPPCEGPIITWPPICFVIYG